MPNAGGDALALTQTADGAAPSPTPREHGEIRSWLDELGPSRTGAPAPEHPANGVNPDETTAIPSRRQPDADAT